MRFLALPCFALICTACGGDSAKSDPDSALPPDLGTRKAGGDWPHFLGPTGDSVSPETGLVAPWPKEGPRLVWQIPTGEGYAAATISRGRLFLFDRVKDQQRLRCLKSETGDPLWDFEYPTDYTDLYNYSGGARCCAVVDRDRVYILGPEGMLHCLRVDDGKVVWKKDIVTSFHVVPNFFGVGSTPVVEGDLLIAQVGGSPKDVEDTRPRLDLPGLDSGVVAFDKYTGDVKWHVTDELASYSSPVLATIGDRRWCFVFARGGLIGLDPATGKVDFHYPWRAPILESVNVSNPVVSGDRVFISETYGPGAALLEVKPGAYKEVWTDAAKTRNKSMQCHWNTPILVDGYLYGCSGRHTDTAELRCIEFATGKVMWSVPDMKRCSLLRVDGHFVCISEDGVLRLLKINPNQYEEVSQIELKQTENGEEVPLLHYPAWAAPVLSHGLLYLRGRDRLVCLELIPDKK
ncbi:MAG TPA: PQQ-binding-like beta-propeller repeat protein [Gemmataceae bacterium]|nr:PQQ-binding-like beta-propeller repeat protein [Gemmataceae bacterium]